MAITTRELSSFLGIPDTEDDLQLDLAAQAANQAVAEYCGRTFDTTAIVNASARVFRPTVACGLRVDDFWETTALVVKVDAGDDGTYESTWVLGTDFYLEPLNGRLHGQAWPYSRIVTTASRSFPTGLYRPAVQVTAAWGWSAMPAAVKQATLIKGARLFRRKDSPEGVLGGFAEFGAVRVSMYEDPDVASLLAPFRRPELAVKLA